MNTSENSLLISEFFNNGRSKIVMPWDPIRYMGYRLTINGVLTFERDCVRKKMPADTIKELTKHMYHPQYMKREAILVQDSHQNGKT